LCHRRVFASIILFAIAAPTTGHATNFLPSGALLRGHAYCDRQSPTRCEHLILVQIRPSPARLVARSIRIRVGSSLRLATQTARRSVRQFGISIRSISESWRLGLQSRIATSICCKLQIQSNIIAHDLELQFPAARIEHSVHLIERRTEAKGAAKQVDKARAAAPVDFIVLDFKGPKLVFETCAELERPGDHTLPRETVIEPQHVVLSAEAGSLRLDVTQAEKIQACVKLETGRVTYRKLIKWPASDGL
jgi:hypothetical protein